MAAEPVFTITYWGITGTLTAPLRPPEVTDKLVEAIRHLVERGKLANLRPGPDLDATIRRVVEQELPYHLRSSYGGNTTCVEVRTPDALLILDCGSGYREFGVALENRWAAQGAAAVRRAHVLVTHPHMDHTYGTPYFVPNYNPANHFTIYGSQVVLDSLAAVLNPRSALSQLYFPPTFDQMTAIKEWREVKAEEELTIGSTRVRTYALRHPGSCLAYRLENAGRSYVFATDHEQEQVPDLALADFARGADVFYTEGQYTQAEYEGRVGISGDPAMKRVGWGHSPIEACVITAVAAGVRELHVGHRDPRRGDADLAEMEAFARRLLAEELRKSGKPGDACKVVIPHESMEVRL
jgi:phosphoribosyl 1,2-cyclic phosphodiesterase